MPPVSKNTAFQALGLDAAIVTVLDELGYEEPTPIQRDAIPALLAGRDLLGQAATGTGKTAAFALPLLQRALARKAGSHAPALLVLVPTRELAMQVAEALHKYGRRLGARVVPIYGGQSMTQQFRSLQRGVDAVVATPGRAIDHIGRRTLVLDKVTAVVLDEADEMLDMGFSEDLEAILSVLPAERQTALFSATLPKRIAAIAEKHLKKPVRIAIPEEARARSESPRIRQTGYLVSRSQKVDALGRILDHENPTSALVFCRTRNEVEELAQALAAHGYRAEALHGGMAQKERDRVMKRFRDGTAELLLATDVAARGLDIGNLTHVINYDVPSAPESYVHRIGRTGRAGREGVALTLIEARERRLIGNIERLTGRRLDMRSVPTVADLRARQLETTQNALRETLAAGGGEPFRVVVESLGREFDVLDIAAAAVKLAHEADERVNRQRASVPVSEPSAFDAPAYTGRTGRKEQTDRLPRRDGPPAADRPPRSADRPARPAPARGPLPPTAPVAFTRIYVSIGKEAGVRPGDLVGAITGEAKIEGSDIGAIEVAERHALVDVRKSRADEVLVALRTTTIRGKKVTASRYRPKEKK
ncbi:MAG: DEAD/DEAH box helicase [Vicinamibacteria bacterium]